MKANRAIRNDRAEVGVGTLIVFIAMVLVAAVAAAVLINTTGTLQERAQATGKEATQEVSSNLKVMGVFGKVTSDKVDELRINVQLSAGALPIDLEKAIIRYSDGVNTFNYKWTAAYSDATTPATCTPADSADLVSTSTAANMEINFISLWLRPTADNTNKLGCSGDSVMDAGDLVELRFSLDDSPDHRLAVRKSASVSIIPETGSPVSADFKTPATYGSDAYVTLR